MTEKEYKQKNLFRQYNVFAILGEWMTIWAEHSLRG